MYPTNEFYRIYTARFRIQEDAAAEARCNSRKAHRAARRASTRRAGRRPT